ncbi:hypothetical protein [Streptomyces sp. NPDC001759]
MPVTDAHHTVCPSWSHAQPAADAGVATAQTAAAANATAPTDAAARREASALFNCLNMCPALSSGRFHVA